MGVWTQDQRIRLAYEETLLVQEFPHFAFQDHAQGGLTTARGTYTSSAGTTYNLCVWLKGGFPHEMPSLYVTAPCPLYGCGSKTIQSYQTSHAMHTWEPDWNG